MKCAVLGEIKDRIDLQVIHAAENAILGYSENSGHETIGQIRIIFERAGKQIAYKANYLIVIPVSKTLLNVYRIRR